MKFRRKSQPQEEAPASSTELAGAAEQATPAHEGTTSAGASAEGGAARGPYDVDELADEVQRVDLGAILVAPSPGRELRLQVNEKSGEVTGVLLAGPDGAMEFQVFAAPRNGDLWSEVRPQIAADVTRRGGTVTEREGRWGTELQCQMPVKRPDGTDAVQPSRIIGVNGSRWLLRASLLGRPALDPDGAAEWEEALSRVAVRRGDQAMPVGRPLGFTMPPDAKRAT